MPQQLHTEALRALLASRLPALKGLTREEREQLVEAAAGMPRAELLQHIAPPGQWHGLTPLALHVLGDLLDGERWTREQLVAATKRKDRHVREAIEILRHIGFPIVSRSNGDESGYRLTDSAQEIEDYLAREVTPRAMRQHEVEAAMREAARRCRASQYEGAAQPAQLPLMEVA